MNLLSLILRRFLLATHSGGKGTHCPLKGLDNVGIWQKFALPVSLEKKETFIGP